VTEQRKEFERALFVMISLHTDLTLEMMIRLRVTLAELTDADFERILKYNT
jgi:hypothetical protein